MDSKDVIVGMKVIPHDKTALFTGLHTLGCDTLRFLNEQGFLYVVCKSGAIGADWILGPDPCVRAGDNFSASDFSPADICVGDTVRVKGDENEYIVKHICNGKYHAEKPSGHIGHTTGYFNARADELTLVRKAKPEKKEEAMFKVGDKVSDELHGYGNGKVMIMMEDGCTPVLVQYACGLRPYTHAGQLAGDTAVALKIREEKPECTFNVGDWVEVVAHTIFHNPGFEIGTRHQIEQADVSPLPYSVKRSNDTEWFKADELTPCAPPEPVTLCKPGDVLHCECGREYRLNVKVEAEK